MSQPSTSVLSRLAPPRRSDPPSNHSSSRERNFLLAFSSVIKLSVNSRPTREKAPTRSPSSIHEVVAEISPTATGELQADTELVADLGYDSLDLVELLVTLEDRLGLPSIDLELLAEVTTVADVERIVEEARASASPGKEPA